MTVSGRDRVTSIDQLFARLTEGAQRHGIIFKVPHTRCGGMASLINAASFIHVGCGCGRSPVEVAADLGISQDVIQPGAAEQHTMLNVQRRLLEDPHDPTTRALLRLMGVTVSEALRWKPSDAGSSPETWGGYSTEYDGESGEAAA